LDAGVPNSVGRALAETGYEVLFHRDVLPDETPDEVVCVTAVENKAVLVAVDNDMKQLAKQHGVTPGAQSMTLSTLFEFAAVRWRLPVASSKRSS
jgi:predicted nuclease of predicted toxin-antitoxin system